VLPFGGVIIIFVTVMLLMFPEEMGRYVTSKCAVPPGRSRTFE
jgi:hypothetical protein